MADRTILVRLSKTKIAEWLRGEEGMCRSCGAAVIWATTDAGKPAPIDAASEEVSPLSNRPIHVNHFATCPRSSEHRKAKI